MRRYTSALTALLSLPLLLAPTAAIATPAQPQKGDSPLDRIPLQLSQPPSIEYQTDKPLDAFSRAALPLASAQVKQSSPELASIIDVQGALEDTDEPSPMVGGVYDFYSFVGRAGQDITISLNSEEFDTYLVLIGPNGDIVADNDDIALTNLNSVINTTLPESGTYIVLVTSFEPEERGSYRLRATSPLGTGDLQATLRWDSIHDLDLAVMAPSGEILAFDNSPLADGGQLDVDANALCGGLTSAPVENIFWPANRAPQGEYMVIVSLYSRCDDSVGPIPFTLTLNIQGTVETFTGTVDETNDVMVFETAVY